MEIDHIFICSEKGAPKGDLLVDFGIEEGPPNTHPGQGTANRRFLLGSMFLELLWISDIEEVRSEKTRRTRLWDRCSIDTSTVCSFGIVFRPGDLESAAQFPTWSYYPSYLPPGLAIEFAQGVPLAEPELVYLPFVRRSKRFAPMRAEQAIPFRDLTRVSVGIPMPERLSGPSQIVNSLGLVEYCHSPEPLLELSFLAVSEMAFDLRPGLPLLLRGIVQKPA